MIKTTTAKRPTVILPDRADAPLLGLLIGTWFLAFLALFGPEVHALVFSRDRTVAALLLALIWLIAPFAIRHFLIWRLQNPAIPQKDGTHKRRPLRTVHRTIEKYIASRANQLGISELIHVFRHPYSVRATNGYVWSRGKSQYLSLTSKAERLFGEGYKGDKAAWGAFQFLVDHELGHIYHRDTNIFLLARSLLWCTLVLLPLKFAAAYMMTWPYILIEFTQILPILTDGRGSTAEFHVFSITASVIAYIGFTALSITFLTLFYQTLKRRREYLADRFAFLQFGEAALATAALRQLADRPVSRDGVPTQSFLGSLISHPDIESRIARMQQKAGDRRRDIELFVLTLAALVLGRLALANQEAAFLGNYGFQKAILSCVYIALTSVMIICAVAAPRETERSEQRSLVWRNAVELTAWAAGTALILGIILTSIWWSTGPARDASATILRWVEWIESLVLIGSLPVVVVVMAACHAWISTSTWALRLNRPILAGAASTALAITLLAIMSYAHQPLDDWRIAQSDAVQAFLYDSLNAARSCNYDERRSDLEREECEKQIIWLVRMMPLIKDQFLHENFYPPIAWLILPQQSFRRAAPVALGPTVPATITAATNGL